MVTTLLVEAAVVSGTKQARARPAQPMVPTAARAPVTHIQSALAG